jgi:hypothetical protein
MGTHLAAHRDRSLRAASIMTALLTLLTVATTSAASTLLESANPAQAAVQPYSPAHSAAGASLAAGR